MQILKVIVLGVKRLYTYAEYGHDISLPPSLYNYMWKNNNSYDLGHISDDTASLVCDSFR